MILTRLELLNFRNYKQQQVEFSPEKNIIVGRNAQGKTNLLEAFYFLSHLKSNRAPRMRELVTEGLEEASVRGLIMDGEFRLNMHVSFGRRGRSVDVNGQKLESAARAKGLVKCVMFSPDDLYVIKGDPARRREFLDETMEELGPVAAKTVLHYKHVLRQRNAVLRSWEEHGTSLNKVIEPWDDALARAGAEIVAERIDMVEKMARYAGGVYEEIAGESHGVAITYNGTFEPTGPQKAQIASSMREELDAARSKEKRTRTTVVGPHRDDVELRLDGREAKSSASQGEQRTLAFCLRVAQKRYLEDETGKVPITLLDDVLSELDRERRAGVLRVAGAGSQAIITTTDLLEDFEALGARVFRVERGTVESV